MAKTKKKGSTGRPPTTTASSVDWPQPSTKDRDIRASAVNILKISEQWKLLVNDDSPPPAKTLHGLLDAVISLA
ncbi:hypothetical protein N7466_006671 [Penicillium verhagenii]|uniref:uncharacterized protein n=1 Tax=Penicillium verhagenii TaxID=1562060 RepID=UPI0025457AFF|nr:uncharacterized protein N7466_006671 [Penicillium verhagenii]KAJ5927715.1 hypothetical protein N7466_006671 [Penicillium verhagenii]